MARAPPAKPLLAWGDLESAGLEANGADGPSGGVFCLRSKRSGFVHFGSAWDLARAQESHIAMLQRGVHPSQHLCFAVHRHGIRAVEFKVVQRVRMGGSALRAQDYEATLQSLEAAERTSYTSHHCARMRDAFTGMFSRRAIARLKLHTLVARHVDLTAATVQIQACWRGVGPRRRARRIRRRLAATALAIYCQSVFRRFRARKRYKRKLQSRRRLEACVRIQRWYRDRVEIQLRDLSRVAEVLRSRHSDKVAAVVRVQCHFRRVLARSRSERLRRKWEHNHSPPVRIQSAVRGKLCRLWFSARLTAIVAMQSAMRGFLAREYGPYSVVRRLQR